MTNITICLSAMLGFYRFLNKTNINESMISKMVILCLFTRSNRKIVALNKQTENFWAVSHCVHCHWREISHNIRTFLLAYGMFSLRWFFCPTLNAHGCIHMTVIISHLKRCKNVVIVHTYSYCCSAMLRWW